MSKTKRKPSRRTDATGRSDRQAKHARIYMWERETPAYRSLCVGARALLIELRLLSSGQGRNNGDIGLSERQAAELLGVDRKTVRGYFAQLVDRGFIRINRKGGFTCKAQIASTWIVTNEPFNGQLATKDYERWRPAGGPARENFTGGISPPDGAKNSPRRRPAPPENSPDGAKNTPREATKLPPDGAKNSPTTNYHTTASGRALARERAAAEEGRDHLKPTTLEPSDVAGARAPVEKSGKSLRRNGKQPAAPVDDRTRADVRRRMVTEVTALGFGTGIVWTQLLGAGDDLDAITDGYAAGDLTAAAVAERIGLRRVNGDGQLDVEAYIAGRAGAPS